MNKKLKVLFICHFSNNEIRDRLPLYKGRFRYLLGICLGGKFKKPIYYDYAPWISNLIEGFEGNNSVDLYIVAPHFGLKKKIVSFHSKGVSYNFFRPMGIPFLYCSWPSFFPVSKWFNYFYNKKRANKIIKEIKPDIINLRGAENDYYSSIILDYDKSNIPILISLQGIYSTPQRFKLGEKKDNYREKIEREIHKRFKYFVVGSPSFLPLLNRDNIDTINFWQIAPRKINIVKNKNINVRKKFDLVFFGRTTPVKGVEDVIDALFIIKKYKFNCKLALICETCSYLSKLQIKINNLDLDNNITIFKDIMELERVHSIVSQASIAILPSRFDGLPGTVIESILLGLPVVTTNVGALGFLNKGEERILFSEIANPKSIADNVIKLLKNPDLCLAMNAKAKEFVIHHFDKYKIVETLILQYKAIVRHFNEKEPIPIDLLYNSKLFK